MSIRYRTLAAAVASTILLVGCSSQPPAEFEDPNPPAVQEQPESDENGSQEPEAPETKPGSSGEVPGAAWPDPDNVVAEDVFPIPQSERDKIRVGIEAIVVTEQTMELRLVMTPEEGGDGQRVWDLLREQANINVRLIDRENLKEYSVLRSEAAGRAAYMPFDGVRFTAGESIAYPIFFAPPEDDIEVIDVQLSSWLPVFHDVPVVYER